MSQDFKKRKTNSLKYDPRNSSLRSKGSCNSNSTNERDTSRGRIRKSKRPKLFFEMLLDKKKFEDCWWLFLSYDTCIFKENSTSKTLSKEQLEDLRVNIYTHFISCIKYTHFKQLSLYRERLGVDDDRRFLTTEEVFNFVQKYLKQVGEFVMESQVDDLLSIINNIIVELFLFQEGLNEIWINFFMNDYWEFVEQGEERYNVMVEYVWRDVLKYKKNFSMVQMSMDLINEQFFQEELYEVCYEVGREIFIVQLKFVNKVKSEILKINSKLQKFEVVFPQIGLYEVLRFKYKMSKFTEKINKNQFQLRNIDPELVKAFSCSAIKNFDNPININFDRPKESNVFINTVDYQKKLPLTRKSSNDSQRSGFVQYLDSKQDLPESEKDNEQVKQHQELSTGILVKEPSQQMAAKLNNSALDAISVDLEDEYIDEANFESRSGHQLFSEYWDYIDDKNTFDDSINQNIDKPYSEKDSQDQLNKYKVQVFTENDQNCTKKVLNFILEKNEQLSHHPTIEKNFSKTYQLYETYKQSRVVSIKDLISSAGIKGKLVVLEDGGRLLVRKTKGGRYTLSENMGGKWYKTPKNNIRVSQLLSDLISTSTPDTNLSMAIMNNLAYASSGSALGNFLADLVQTNQPIHVLMSKFAASSLTGIVIGVVMSEVPYFGIALASIFGIFAVKNVLSNKMIPGAEKARRIFKGLTINGATWGLSVAGGVAGHLFIPIPIAGAFIGSLLSGFTASAFSFVVDKLTKAKVNIETLVIFLWYTRHDDGTWTFDGLKNEHISCETHDSSIWLINWLRNKINCNSFLTLDEIKLQIVEKKKTILSILSDIYDSTIPFKLMKKHDKKSLERIWLTSIVFAINSYFYFCLIQLVVKYEKDQEDNNASLKTIPEFSEDYTINETSIELTQNIEELGESCKFTEKENHQVIDPETQDHCEAEIIESEIQENLIEQNNQNSGKKNVEDCFEDIEELNRLFLMPETLYFLHNKVNLSGSDDVLIRIFEMIRDLVNRDKLKFMEQKSLFTSSDTKKVADSGR